jgi:TolB protein
VKALLASPPVASPATSVAPIEDRRYGRRMAPGRPASTPWVLAGRTVVALVLVAAACTRSTTTTSAPPASATGMGTLSGAPVSGLPGLLLIKDADGNLVTLRPDGSQRTTLAEVAPGELDIGQATWSADGGRVAWAQLDTVDGHPTPSIVTSDPGGQDRLQAPTPIWPFYLSWDPTGKRVGFLGSRGEGVEMGVVEQPQPHGVPIRPIGSGPFFYFSWGPDGQHLLAHTGAARLDELRLDGRSTPVESQPGEFQAPVWSADGSSYVYSLPRSGGGDGQRLVVRDVAAGGEPKVLATPKGSLSFVLSPDGQRVAYRALGPGEQDFYDRSYPTKATDVGVTVVDADGGDSTLVTPGPAIAFYWSPDGTRLLILEPVYVPSGQILFRWRIWDGRDTFSTGLFQPSFSLLQEYVPFFSQYAQSSTLWAPDGSAFAYPADSSSGPPVIMVQPAEPGAEPFVAGQGSFVAWRPSSDDTGL